jgi:hypothetical protein
MVIEFTKFRVLIPYNLVKLCLFKTLCELTFCTNFEIRNASYKLLPQSRNNTGTLIVLHFSIRFLKIHPIVVLPIFSTHGKANIKIRNQRTYYERQCYRNMLSCCICILTLLYARRIFTDMIPEQLRQNVAFSGVGLFVTGTKLGLASI